MRGSEGALGFMLYAVYVDSVLPSHVTLMDLFPVSPLFCSNRNHEERRAIKSRTFVSTRVLSVEVSIGNLGIFHHLTNRLTWDLVNCQMLGMAEPWAASMCSCDISEILLESLCMSENECYLPEVVYKPRMEQMLFYGLCLRAPGHCSNLSGYLLLTSRPLFMAPQEG